MAAIEIEDLVKTYRIAERPPGLLGALRGLLSRKQREVRALDGLQLSIEQGEMVGFLGPNGAGKSTTVKILAGILQPDGGRCVVNGRVPWKQRRAHVADIGVVFGQRCQLWWDLPVVESLDLLARIYRLQDPLPWRRELVGLLDIDGLLDQPVRQLSLGQRMRCELAAALQHRPRLLYLDEPTIGLDAPGKLAVRRFLRELQQRGEHTVLLTTHDMDDVEALCKRVVVIGRGRALLDGPIEELRRHEEEERHLCLELHDEEAEIALPPQARLIERSGSRLRIAVRQSELPAHQLMAQIATEHRLRDVTVEHRPLEEVVADFYRNGS